MRPGFHSQPPAMTSPGPHASSRLVNGNHHVAGPSAPAASATTLPDRNVASESIEEAYVRFIFYCNPALSLDADTEALRDAFRNPPKSGGKSFDTFAIYELVRKFYGKEIKTWTELTIKLGVEPPDPTKDESSQKVTQYGVRLKKWLNSLHVKSFFEYLMNIPNDYWTKIPNDPDPTSQHIRDGVALEDDMALRALIPHIRPKRGRKRPDDPEGTPTAQRMRMSPSSAIDAVTQGGGGMTSWPRPTEPHLSHQVNFPRSAHPGHGQNDGSETPFSQWPNSAITPTMRGSFWDDALEPQSAITPTQSKLGRQRRGAKNVSSAWKPGGLDGIGKTRGRPPINRTPIEGPSNPWSAHPQTGTRLNPNMQTPEQVSNQSPFVQVNHNMHPSLSHTHGPSGPVPPPPDRITSAPAIPTAHRLPPSNHPRPGRPSISLQVPERAGGPVRLATPPPPVVMLNGQETAHEPAVNPTAAIAAADTIFSERWNDLAKEATAKYEFTPSVSSGRPMDSSHATNYYFEKTEDRTNVDSLMSYFVQTAHDSDWFDEHGNPDERASMNEALALVNATLENMLKTSASPQAFLINLAALAGARTLLATTAKCYRLGDDDDFYNYRFEWEYRFGHFRGQFNMTQSVPRAMWKKPRKEAGMRGDGDGGKDTDGIDGLSVEDWQRKYTMLLGEMKRRDQELSDLRAKVMTGAQRDRS